MSFSFFYLFIYLFIYLLLDIFFIYISNANLKVPYTLPLPCSPTHPLSLHLHNGVKNNGFMKFLDKWMYLEDIILRR